MASSDEDDAIFGASPTVSDSDSGGEAAQVKSEHKKRKKSSGDSKKKAKRAKRIDSDDEDDDDDNAEDTKPKNKFVEDEASESDNGSGGGGSDEEDDDDDDDQVKNEYEQDGFVVDDEDDDDDDSDDDTAHRRRRRKKKERKLRRLKQKIEDVDDEDLRLVRENLGMDTGPDRSDSDEEEDTPAKPSGRKTKEDGQYMSRELIHRMFGDSDDEDDDADAAAPRRPDNFLGDEEYASDDMDEFIVDDDEEGRDMPRRRRRHVERESSLMQGPSLYQMDEAEELFGDIGDFLEATRGAPNEDAQKSSSTTTKSKKAILLEKYEPSMLKEHMMTDEIISVRDRDIPERYQQLFRGRQFPDAALREEESEWIGAKIMKSLEKRNLLAKAASHGEIVLAIDNVLRFYHEDKVEPAFVQRYCKEFWKNAGLHSEDLYEILDLDVKWDKLDRKRKSLQAGLARAVDAARGAEQSSFVRDCYEELLRVPDEKSYQDMSDFFALDTTDDAGSLSSSGGAGSGKFRRPGRRNYYQICTKGGLRPLSMLFTMNASVLGGLVAQRECDESLRVVPTPDESPDEVAKRYTSPEFPTTSDVMKGARHIAACRVAAEPNVRKCLRDIYRQGARISTSATDKGREDIDEFHYCHGLQYIMEMPALEMLASGNMFVRLARAEKEGLLTISIMHENPRDLIDRLDAIYNLHTGDDWDSHRSMILEDAVSQFLLVSFEKELHRDLVVASRDHVLKECGEAMRERLLVRPFESKDGNEPFIVSVWVDADLDSMAHIVAIDQNGELVDKAQGYCKHERRFVDQLTNTFYKFLAEHSQVDVIVINMCGGIKCMDMGELVSSIRAQLGRQNAVNFGRGDGRDYIEILFLKDDVARMYGNSKRAANEFPEESVSIRSAIGLARHLRNPASELCGLWGNVAMDEPSRGRELLYLNVHPLQRSLVKDTLLKQYDRIFYQVVNKFGVDINLLANHKHTSYQIQFVCGLGTVKGTAVLDRVRAKSFIERRQELLSKGFVGKIVYRNCAGFVRIRERDALKESPLNPLDDTRIHPESYYMAVKMCGDANNNSTIDMYDPNQYSYAVEDTMFQSQSTIKNHTSHSPYHRLEDMEIADALSELDLHAYASRLELQKKGPKLATLEYIKRELRYPYFDKRMPYKLPDESDLFFLLHGETRETFKVGMIIPATILRVRRHDTFVRLHNGMRAVLRNEFLPDYMNPEFVKNNDQTVRGLIVNAKVMDFQLDDQNHFQVILGCDDGSMKDVSKCFCPEKFPNYTDKSYVVDDSIRRIDKLLNRLTMDDDKMTTGMSAAGPGGSAMQQQAAVAAGVGLAQPKRKKRQIGHPLFKNINCRTAMNHLREQNVGDVVIRPSTLGSDHLTLTWKMLDGVYRHFDILELNKASEARLGETLVIKEAKYDSIDELIARFIDPMNELVDEVVRFKYFKKLSDDEIVEDLIKQKKENPSRIPYSLHIYTRFPGCFTITFIARVTPHSCHMEVKPNGFRFFGRIESSILPTLNQALQFFKMKALVAPARHHSSSSSSSRAGGSSGSTNAYFRDDAGPFASRSTSGTGNGGGNNGGSRHDSRFDDRGRGGGGSGSGGHGNPGGYYGDRRYDDRPRFDNDRGRRY